MSDFPLAFIGISTYGSRLSTQYYRQLLKLFFGKRGTIRRSWIICFNELSCLILCDLSVYGVSSSDLNSVQHFLDRCYKSRYISRKLNIRELLERSDCSIFRKALRTNSPLVRILPETNFTNYALRKPCFYHPTVETERFKSSYANRLILSYDINSLMQIDV